MIKNTFFNKEKEKFNTAYSNKMSGRNKRNKEKFNTLFRKMTRKVSIDDLKITNGFFKRADCLNQNMTVSKFALLSKETRRWAMRSPHEFNQWVTKWNGYIDELEAQRRRVFCLADFDSSEEVKHQRIESLTNEYFEGLKRFVGGHEGETPEARVKSLLLKRRAKVTNKILRTPFWPTGSLIEVRNFFSKRYNFPSTGLNPNIQEIIYNGWFIPINGDRSIEKILASYFFYERIDVKTITFPKVNTLDLLKDSKLTGLIFDDQIFFGETAKTFRYCWIRIVRVLAGSQEWAMILHPTLGKTSLSSNDNVKIISPGKNGFKRKAIEVTLDEDNAFNLRRALVSEGEFDETLIQ